MKQNKIITYKQYNQMINRLNIAKQKGLILDIKKNKLKIVLGVICLGVAIFPNGLGLIFYPIGFSLLGLSLMDLENFKRIIKYKLKGLI